MKIFRSLFALLLTLSLLLSFVGCGYPAVRSSGEERETVLTLDGKYDVSYELYRFYFLSELALSERDPALLTAEEKTALFAEIHGKALAEIASVYAVFKLCEAHEIDVESRDFDKYVKENVIAAIEGDENYVGYGDKDTYLAEIKNAYMNDSVFRFLLRYRYAEQVLGAKLRDTGALQSDPEHVLAYMSSDECVRVSWIYIPYTVLPGYTEAKLAETEAEAKRATDEGFLAMTHKGLPDLYSDEELDRGFYLGKYQLDPYYEALTETAFSLEMGETSSFIDSGDGKYIVRRLPKDKEYLSDPKNLPDFTEYYLLNKFYGLLAEEGARLADTAVTAELFATLSLDEIRMPE